VFSIYTIRVCHNSCICKGETSVLCQRTGWEERLINGLFYVDGDVKHCPINHNFKFELNIPKQWYGEQTKEADNQLKTDPVLHKISEQWQKARSQSPEDINNRSGECTILRSKQFTSNYKAWQNYSLTATQN